LSLFGTRRKKRKTREQKTREKGKRSYSKGKAFEKKAYPLLARKGFKVTKSRVHSRKRDEFDGLATDKHGRTYGVEVKATKTKVTPSVVKGLKRKVSKHKLLHGGIIVSRKGFTESALREAKLAGITAIKYKSRRKKKRGWLF